LWVNFPSRRVSGYHCFSYRMDQLQGLLRQNPFGFFLSDIN
jgi:hypothetical protein